jgi:hypothetical protein
LKANGGGLIDVITRHLVVSLYKTAITKLWLTGDLAEIGIDLTNTSLRSYIRDNIFCVCISKDTNGSNFLNC